MTEPMDQQVVDWIKTVLSAITTVAGYHNTLPADRIFTEDEQLPDDRTETDPYAFIDDIEETDVTSDRAKRHATLQIGLTLRVPGTNDDPARVRARKLMADVRKAFAPYADINVSREQTPAGVKSVKLGGRTIGRREDGSRWIDIVFPLEVVFQENHDS